MRELWIGTGTSGAELDRPLTCEYYILIRELEDSQCESYGVKIRLLETGASEEVLDLTMSAARAEALASLLHRNLVTPCTLREVVEDWL